MDENNTEETGQEEKGVLNDPSSIEESEKEKIIRNLADDIQSGDDALNKLKGSKLRFYS
jgi:hypothetical protein